MSYYEILDDLDRTYDSRILDRMRDIAEHCPTEYRIDKIIYSAGSKPNYVNVRFRRDLTDTVAVHSDEEMPGFFISMDADVFIRFAARAIQELNVREQATTS